MMQVLLDIDKYAYSSRLKHKAPGLKLLFTGLTLGVCLWANAIPVSLFVIGVMMWVTVIKGGTPFSLFLKLFLVPMSFLCLGVLTIAVNVAAERSTFLFSFPILGAYLGASRTGVEEAGRLFFKALGAVSCLYYLALSTPMLDLLAVLRRLRAPKLMVELMGLIYRFIFVLLETATTMITAQNSRLGYANLATGFRSLGALGATLFIRAYKRGNELYTALEARGYTGELNVLEEPFTVRWTEYLAPVGLNLFLVATTLALRHVGGGRFV